jgi:hypothetical protein
MKLSYSAVQNYYKCPQYFKYKNIDNLDDNSDKSADLAFGTALHMGLQDLYEGGTGIDCFNVYWNSLENSGLTYGRVGHRELENLGNVFIERFERLHKKKFEPMYIEQRVEVPKDGFIMAGTADLIAKYEGKVSVIDYKTAGYAYDKYKIIHNEQMYNYAYLVEKNYGIKVEQVVYVVFVKNPREPRIQIISKSLNDEKLNYMLSNMDNVCKRILKDKENNDFTRNPSSCVIGKNVCPFFNLCFKDASE